MHQHLLSRVPLDPVPSRSGRCSPRDGQGSPRPPRPTPAPSSPNAWRARTRSTAHSWHKNAGVDIARRRAAAVGWPSGAAAALQGTTVEQIDLSSPASGSVVGREARDPRTPWTVEHLRTSSTCAPHRRRRHGVVAGGRGCPGRDDAHRDHRDRRRLPAALSGAWRICRAGGSSTAPRPARPRPCAGGTCSSPAAALRRAGRAAPGQVGREGDRPGPRTVAGRDPVRLPHPRVGAAPNVDVCYRVQVADGTGTHGHLQSLVLQDTASGARRSVPADALFVLIGAQPRTTGSATPWHATGGGSSSPARTCQPAPAGPPAARRCHWRPACPGCSQPVTCAADRSTGSPPRSAKARPQSRWCTATWPGRQPAAGR